MSCDPEELCEECPEWIFTLADLLMCMMGLFVILWVLKPDVADTPEEQTREEIQQEEFIRDFRLQFGATAADVADRQQRIEHLYRLLEEMKREGEGGKGHAERPADGAEGTDPEVTTIREGELAGLGGRVHFEPGDATLADPAKSALLQIAGKIRGFRNVVLVKGHTGADDLPPDIARGGPEARRLSLELSLARATTVAETLIAAGVSPDILRVQAAGPYEPLRRRAYEADDRRLNRRVEVQATDQLTADRADEQATFAP